MLEITKDHLRKTKTVTNLPFRNVNVLMICLITNTVYDFFFYILHAQCTVCTAQYHFKKIVFNVTYTFTAYVVILKQQMFSLLSYLVSWIPLSKKTINFFINCKTHFE